MLVYAVSMSAHVQAGGHPRGLAATVRTDRWWVEPLLTGLGFMSFVVYSTWAAFQGNHYWHETYLSPFYSPVLFVDDTVAGAAPVAHAWLGLWPDWLRAIWPSGFPTSPAWLILGGPMTFRATCYYYRKFYYRAFFLSPPACSVNGVPVKKYRGETLLFLFQNLHRYTWYIAVCYVVILYYDAYIAFFRQGEFGVGVGSIVLLLNATLLAMYVFGCHSCRHLTAGRLDCFTCTSGTKVQYGLWRRVTRLNERHMLWAWVSMVWVGLADVYVRLCSLDVIHDYSTWG